MGNRWMRSSASGSSKILMIFEKFKTWLRSIISRASTMWARCRNSSTQNMRANWTLHWGQEVQRHHNHEVKWNHPNRQQIRGRIKQIPTKKTTQIRWPPRGSFFSGWKVLNFWNACLDQTVDSWKWDSRLPKREIIWINQNKFWVP